MTLSQRLRLSFTVFRYDQWLDLKGVPGAARRPLRRELRANLDEAAADVGVDAALARLGSPEALATAHAAAVHDPRRPAWGVGLVTAAVVAVGYAWTWFLAALAWLDGAQAAAPGGGSAQGTITLYPGSRLAATWGPEGLSLDVFYPPMPAVVLIGLVFLLAARVWRLTRRPARRGASTPSAASP